jgi:hypothetical protein
VSEGRWERIHRKIERTSRAKYEVGEGRREVVHWKIKELPQVEIEKVRG